MNDYRSTITRHANEIRKLHARIHETFRAQPHGPEHKAACAAFHEYCQSAFNNLDDVISGIPENDPDAIEYAIQFLEVNPKFHRSGYIKETMLRRLKHASFDKKQKQRLQRIILSQIERPYFTREYHYYANLAVHLNDKSLQDELNTLSKSTNSKVVDKAKDLLVRLAQSH